MPGRQSSVLAQKSRLSRNKPKKRSQIALSIASKQVADELKLPKHRLGKIEESENAPNTRSAISKNSHTARDIAALETEGGSDSDGNHWRIGEVDSDQDSDLDSDEALGESDEERFEGFVFRGSFTRTGGSVKEPSNSKSTLDLDLSETSAQLDNLPNDELDDSLGDEAIDLALMLDDARSGDEDLLRPNERSSDSKLNSSSREDFDDSELSDDGNEGQEEEEKESIASEEDEEEGEDPQKLSALQNLITSLPTSTDERPAKRQRLADGTESTAPSRFGLTSKTKLGVEDLMPTINNPLVKRSLKLIATGNDKNKKSNSAFIGKLEIPLAKRQQDRIDRTAAYEKSKETLDRWVDSVTHNRRAEHLVFPLPDSASASTHTNHRFAPSTSTSKPLNDLEATIEGILQESGISSAKPGEEEQMALKAEDQRINKMSLDDVRVRQRQLRMARELLFREEVRAKRIKKIKSKAFRRVHRRQRERLQERIKIANGLENMSDSEAELERKDRLRAEERMGARHRESRWAKEIKESKRSAWDTDARRGVTEMAKRDEDLRKRIQGKLTKSGSQSGSDTESEVSEDLSDSEVENSNGKLLSDLSRLAAPKALPGVSSGLSSMKFMQKAQSIRSKENDKNAEKIRRALENESLSSDEDDSNAVGRRKYGPSSLITTKNIPESQGPNDYEEPLDSENYATEKQGDGSKDPKTLQRNGIGVRKNRTKAGHSAKSTMLDPSLGDSSHLKILLTRINRDSSNILHDLSNRGNPKQCDLASKEHNHTSLLVPVEIESEANDHDLATIQKPISHEELIRKAFAGPEALEEFDKEKRAAVREDEEKISDSFIPGWGSWTGAGISKLAKTRFKAKALRGNQEAKRKDLKLARVIINERRIKKACFTICSKTSFLTAVGHQQNTKYLATSLPHPFETKFQYERSLRLPVGPEWTTKETFQIATKPRVILKQGIIAPMKNPFL
ncbi:MAG: hypothetical protein M1829_003034 [Trizodia sp. TS-e1964]|nr:MAG: hypothetical protein M1829_003034 [Trizodia sp. TS-e1964]